MTISAHDVARELRRQLPTAGVVKLHKLLYYCQGWGLAFTEKPLFKDEIEAWTNGPVVAQLWAAEKHGRNLPAPEELDLEAKSIVSFVVARYGRLTGKQLIRLTHSEAPWRDASEASDDEWISNSPTIPQEALIDFFSADDDLVAIRELIDAARADETAWTRLTHVPTSAQTDDAGEISRRLLAAAS